MEESLKIPIKINKHQNQVEEKEEGEIEKGSAFDLYSQSNILSQVFFFWAYKILKLARKTKLSSSLLGPLSTDNDSHHYSEYLNYYWDTLNYKSKKSNALMKVIMRANIFRIMKVLIFSVMSSGLQFLIILILKEYIDYFQFPKERRFTLLQLGLAFIFTQFTYCILYTQTLFNLDFIGFRAKFELNCFIYNKLLRISPSSMSKRASHGEIVNFLQVDSGKVHKLMFVSSDLITSPILIIAYVYLLFDFFALSFLSGFGILLIFFGINYYIFSYYIKIADEVLEKKDSRMKLTTEIFESIKIIKLYNWENEFKRRLLSSREAEVAVIKKGLIADTINISLFWLCPVCIAIGTIGVYIHFNDTIQISTLLIGLALFTKLQYPVTDLPWSINGIIETLISMRRIEKFIRQQEYEDSNVIVENKNEKPYAIKIENGTFTWGKRENKEEKNRTKENDMRDSDDEHNEGDDKLSLITDTKSTLKDDDDLDNSNNPENFEGNDFFKPLIPETMDNQKRNKVDYDIVLSNINLEIKQGESIGIIGEVGSGKTSLLEAILNSLILLSKPECDGIHITGSIGYVSQTPWIQNDTIKNNIIFFNEHDEDKYQKVLEVSQLKYDLSNLEAKDMTEIGEKGINLSGGQKVRVSLARALYANPDIYLFDDPISALDANIGRQIMDDCIIKHLKNKTRIIATHALYFLKDMDRIIYLEKGEIKWSGTYDDIIHQDFFISLSKIEKQRKNSHHKGAIHLNDNNNAEEEEGRDNDAKGEIALNDNKNREDKPKESNQLIKKIMKDEDQEIGVVKIDVYLNYCKFMGGIFIISIIVVVMFLWAINKCGSDLWLAYWSEPENQNPVRKGFFFSVYSGLGIGSAFFVFLRLLLLSIGVIHLSLFLHKDMITCLIKAPINLFHEVVSRGQLYNRLSSDLENLEDMHYIIGSLLTTLFGALGSIAICGVYDLYSLLFIPFIGVVGYFLTSFYLTGRRDLTRLNKISSSPILNTVSETIPGLVSIKSFNRKNSYLNKFFQAINDNFKVSLYDKGSEVWFSFQFELLSCLFVTYLVVYTNIFEETSTPQSVGIMFTYSLILQDSLSYMFICCASLETQMVSMERCLVYTKVQSEKPSNHENDLRLIKNEWPQNGVIRFVDYSVKYRPDTEVVLKNLNFAINQGEKIGVIGRTGSGKSTICLCLFRILEPLTGTIYIDDVDICSIGLDLLRQNITIIPQDPTLMQGTLKYNIDPFDTKSNKEILDLLIEVGFNIEDKEESLNKEIEEKGANLSVGEKQLVCIARAMLRKSKIIVMDEATANIDIRTEEKIQNALKKLMINSTIVTVAHRIKTVINYDRILVMDGGRVAEFDTPSNLFKDEQSMFYQLYSKSII